LEPAAGVNAPSHNDFEQAGETALAPANELSQIVAILKRVGAGVAPSLDLVPIARNSPDPFNVLGDKAVSVCKQAYLIVVHCTFNSLCAREGESLSGKVLDQHARLSNDKALLFSELSHLASAESEIGAV
jgi:hypothetical protein